MKPMQDRESNSTTVTLTSIQQELLDQIQRSAEGLVDVEESERGHKNGAPYGIRPW